MATSEIARARADFRLQDRFAATSGDVLLTGVQAVCRVPLDVRRIDQRRGQRTRAFVTGYQGSPLGTLDFTMRPLDELLEAHGVDFRPGMNELLAATAVQGTQSVPDLGTPLHGVTGYWYGKTPGVDQALDAIRHGNLMGTHPEGGVLAFCGDDPNAKSSTVPCCSESVLRAALVPTLSPADPQDVVDLGAHGVAMSRATGMWVALKVATNVADGYGVVTLHTESFEPEIPLIDGRPYRHVVTTKLAAASAVAAERNLQEVRLPLVLEYARLNRLNVITARGGNDTIGIVAAGQVYAEARQSLADMGFRTADDLDRAGIRLLKIGLVWPLEPEIVQEFADGLDQIVVVEDKGPQLELMIKDLLFNNEKRPEVLGQNDPRGRPLLPAFGGIDADAISAAIAPLILARGDNEHARARLESLNAPTATVGDPLPLTVATRTPYFCSGCPHNASTKIPQGSMVGNGIGCHTMTMAMDPDQSGIVTGLTQMGGEGAQWIGQQPYVHAEHLFQNLGDGTLSHSGLLAIRASIAAGTNITYKVLYNATVAMTGGQDAVGGYTVAQLTHTLAAEGVKRVYVTTDHPENYRRTKLAKIATVHDRVELLSIQEELRKLPGTTVLIHDQPCAAELRRKRKRGKAAVPAKRIVINERLCEGCGDCGRQSNCLSVAPVETEFGRKTQIHQASCNLDFSCLQGDCPSFMEVIPGTKPPAGGRVAPIDVLSLPDPQPLFGAHEFTVRITGIGGTGIVTVAQVLATAGFLDWLDASGLDQVGLSQKAGPVVSDLKLRLGLAQTSPKINTQACDLYLVCDALVGSNASHLSATRPGHTVAVVSTANVPTGAMIRHPETAIPAFGPMVARIDRSTRPAQNAYLDAGPLAESLFGSDQYANMLLVGAAFQIGAIPLSAAAIERAIELNGVAVEANTQAFRHGRRTVLNPNPESAENLPAPVRDNAPPTGVAADLIASIDAPATSGLERSLRRRIPDLIDYQNVGYARRYADVVAAARAAEQRAVPGDDTFTIAVAENLHKLMAYKDEYEVARLALDPTEKEKLAAQFGDDAKVVWKLFPPVLREMGLKRKLSLGRWFTVFYAVLRWAKWLRGTPLDVFGYTHVRRTERALVEEYAATVRTLVTSLTADNHTAATRIAQLPDIIRGYEQIKLDNIDKYHERLAESTKEFHGLVQPAQS